MTTGEHIRELRIERNLTQKRLGELIGSTQQMIAQYENGKRNPKMETLAKMADALNVSVSELYPGITVNFDTIEHICTTVSKAIEKENLENDYREYNLLLTYRKLNDCGKEEAIKRVEELTEIKKYTEISKKHFAAVYKSDPDQK